MNLEHWPRKTGLMGAAIHEASLSGADRRKIGSELMLWPWQSKNSWGAPQGSPSFSFIQVDMISLAKQIIEATPERIKREDFVGLSEAGATIRERTGAVGLSETMSWLASYLENVDHFPSSAPPR